MSSYFRYKAFYEKCGCPGSPSNSLGGKRGRADRAGEGGSHRPEMVRWMTKPDTGRSSEDFTT